MSASKDINGKESSKRKWARVLILNGLVMAWITFLTSIVQVIYMVIKHGTYQAIPNDLIYLQLLTGLGAIGFTLGERFTRVPDTNKDNE